MKTLIVNLFGGPGCGKSTGAAWLFSQLKMSKIDCEYVSEFAKDKVWEENSEVFKCQFYITGKQAFKISRCYGKVNVIITDSPIILGSQYTDSESLKVAIKDEFKKYDPCNLNFLLHRTCEYQSNGRNQTESEAKLIDQSLKEFLDSCSIDYTVYPGDLSGYQCILKDILKAL